MKEQRTHLKCWASALPCAGDLTKEHVISNSILKLFGHLNFNIDGKGYRLGSNSYVMRNLCLSHNNSLRRFDNEAYQFFSTWKRYVEQKEKDETPEQTTLNGHWIENWFAKSFFNSVLFNEKVLKPKDKLLYPTPHWILPALYQDQIFEPPFGIYTINAETPLVPNRSLWGMSAQTSETWHHSSIDFKWRRYVAPTAFYVCFGGFELVGFFNLTQVGNETALNSFLKPMLTTLQEKGEYRSLHFATGNNGPTKILKADWNSKDI